MLSSRIKWARCAKNKVYRSIFAARECRRPAHTPGELLALVTDAIALAIQFHHEASHVRRLAMKKELHKDYGSVCSTVVGTAEFLFGDFSKLTKDITDANKLKKKMRPPPFQSTGRGDMYNAHSHLTHGSFARQGENRSHPYQYHEGRKSTMAPKIRIF